MFWTGLTGVSPLCLIRQGILDVCKKNEKTNTSMAIRPRRIIGLTYLSLEVLSDATIIADFLRRQSREFYGGPILCPSFGSVSKLVEIDNNNQLTAGTEDTTGFSTPPPGPLPEASAEERTGLC